MSKTEEQKQREENLTDRLNKVYGNFKTTTEAKPCGRIKYENITKCFCIKSRGGTWMATVLLPLLVFPVLGMFEFMTNLCVGPYDGVLRYVILGPYFALTLLIFINSTLDLTHRTLEFCTKKKLFIHVYDHVCLYAFLGATIKFYCLYAYDPSIWYVAGTLFAFFMLPIYYIKTFLYTHNIDCEEFNTDNSLKITNENFLKDRHSCQVFSDLFGIACWLSLSFLACYFNYQINDTTYRMHYNASCIVHA